MVRPMNPSRPRRTRPVIAFFEYVDVFEDFYPHYGVTQEEFATRWDNSGNHAFLTLIQEHVGDVVWFAFSLEPQLEAAHHQRVGCAVRILRSSWPHRQLWKLFYLPKMAWRWRYSAFRPFATVASYLAPLSVSCFHALRREQPDFIFVQDYASGKFDVLTGFSRLLGVPLIAYHSGSQPERYLGRTVRRWTLPLAHRIIASGQSERRMLASHFAVHADRIPVILTPIDTARYRPEERAAACHGLGLDPGLRHLLFVGRLDDAVKRVSSIILAFSRLRERHPLIQLVIVGDGADKLKLENLAAEHAPGRVRFAGWVRQISSKVHYYSAAECLVLASAREGFPTVVGEAMACGTPVVSSRVGAVRELVTEGETGWLFPAGDDAGLCRSLDRALSQPAFEAAAMRQRARELAVRRVSPAAVAAGLQECFRQPAGPMAAEN
jgi:glycosyltransferase involved in cell wall biosynthesis